MEGFKKVFFVQEIGDKEYETESLWCKIASDYFIVDNIPIIAKRISLGDTIIAEFNEDDQQYYFDDFIAVSGNTTVRVYLKTDFDIHYIKTKAKENQCQYEVLAVRKIIALNIPKEIEYSPIKKILESGEQSGKWIYEESCLEHNY